MLTPPTLSFGLRVVVCVNVVAAPASEGNQGLRLEPGPGRLFGAHRGRQD